MTAATDILRRPIDQNHTPGATTIGHFLAELLARLLETDTDFDPHHPFAGALAPDDGSTPVSVTHWADDLETAVGDQHTFTDIIDAVYAALAPDAGDEEAEAGPQHTDIPDLIEGLRRDAGDYGRLQRNLVAPGETVSWDQSHIRAWEAAALLGSLAIVAEVTP